MRIGAKIWPLGIAVLALAACSERAEDAQARAGNAMAEDVAGAADNLAARADRLTDRLGDHLQNAQDRVIDGAAARVEDRLGNELDRAADEAGAALTRAGDALSDRDRPAREPAPAEERARQ